MNGRGRVMGATGGAGWMDRLDSFYLPSGQGRLASFEGLRGWAFLMIFHVHFLGYYEARHYFLEEPSLAHRLLSALNAGHAGVDLFFLLTGFLIYATIHKNSPHFLRFIGNRYWRLFPALLLVNAPLIALQARDIPTVIDNLLLLKLFPDTTYLNVVEWVLTYQIYFYLLAGVWFILLARFAWLESWPFFFLLVLILYALHQGEMFGFHAMPRFISIFWGVGLAKLYHTPRLWRPLAPALAQAGPWALVLFYLARWHWSGHAAQIIHSRWQWAAYFGTVDLCFFLITASLLTPKSPLHAIFGSRPLRMLGAVSYSAFLIHACWAIPLAETLLAAMPQGLPFLGLHYGLSLVATLLIASLMYHYLERPYFAGKPAAVKAARHERG